MADRALLVVPELSERSPRRRVEEDGVVAEAAGATRCWRDEALDDALDDASVRRPVDDRDHAPEACRPALRRHPAEPLQQKRDAAGVVETRPAEARGADPRLAPQ